MSADPDLTRKISQLARLELSNEEIQLFTSQLAQVIQYVDQLKEVSVEGVEPYSLDLPTPLREDIARPTENSPSKIIETATETFQGGFKVPRIL